MTAHDEYGAPPGGPVPGAPDRSPVDAKRLWAGGRWTEGPAYFAGGRYLVFSDIPNDRMIRFDECSGTASVNNASASAARAAIAHRILMEWLLVSF